MAQDRTRLPGERGFALVLAALAAFLLWQSYRIAGFESLTSAGIFPMLAASAMLVAAIVAMRGAWRLPSAAIGDDGFRRRLVPAVLVGFTATIAGLALTLQWLGFSLSAFLFLMVSMRVLGSRRWVLNLAVALAAIAVVHLVFERLFSVVLPPGILMRWLP
jgi:putative tricarboxylic transport membrane protein